MMRTEDEEFATAYPAKPFRDEFERDCWVAAWCEACCNGTNCALLNVANRGRTPNAWRRGDRFSLSMRFLCREWGPA